MEAFLDGAIRFTDIARVVADVLAQPQSGSVATLEGVLEADAAARRAAQALLTRLASR
ncbi:1-deoxy-D-xylulose 5-phosphate reductoisomerase [compost metagenome]